MHAQHTLVRTRQRMTHRGAVNTSDEFCSIPRQLQAQRAGQRTRRGESHLVLANDDSTYPTSDQRSTQVAAAVHYHRPTPTTIHASQSKAVNVSAGGGQPVKHTHLTERGTRCTEAFEHSCAADTWDNWRVGMGCAQVTRPGSETRSEQLDSVRQTEVDYANWKGN